MAWLVWKINELDIDAWDIVPSGGHQQVTLHEQIGRHTAGFLDENRQQIDTIKSEQPHHHRRCNLPPFFMMESGFVFLFSFMVPSFPKLFLLCALEPGEKWQRRCISFSTKANLQHTHTVLYVAVHVIVVALSHWLRKTQNGSNCETNKL